ERVRTSYFSSRSRRATRIVFDLSKDVPYRVIEDGGGIIRIVFGDTARAPQNQTAGPVMVPEPRAHSVSNPTSPALKLASVLVVPEPLPAPQAPAAVAPAASPLMAAAESRQQQPQTQVTIVPPAPPQVPTT